MKQRQRGRPRKPGQFNNGGGNYGGGNNGNPNRSFESAGPDIKVRGSAQTIFEKYTQLGRDAMQSGDRVLAENYLQHAEHYLRVMKAMQPSFVPRQEPDANFDEDAVAEANAQGEDGDEGEDGREAGNPQQGQQNQQRPPRMDNQNPNQNQPRRDRDWNRDRDGNREPRGDRPDREPRGDRGDRPDRGERRDFRRDDNRPPREDGTRDGQPVAPSQLETIAIATEGDGPTELVPVAREDLDQPDAGLARALSRGADVAPATDDAGEEAPRRPRRARRPRFAARDGEEGGSEPTGDAEVSPEPQAAE